MLDIKAIRANPKAIAEQLKKRGGANKSKFKPSSARLNVMRVLKPSAKPKPAGRILPRYWPMLSV